MRSGMIVNRAVQGIVLLLAICIGQIAMAEEAWRLDKDANGIKVYTRNIANSQLREFKGEVELATKSERVISVLKDATSFKKWMPDVVVSTLLSLSKNEQLHYLENATPWPVSNRDGVYQFTYSHADDAGVEATIVRVKAVPDYKPEREGKVRIPKSDGFWKIVPKGNGVTVTWQIHADPGGAIPNWLANATVVDTPFKMLKNLRSYIQSQQP